MIGLFAVVEDQGLWGPTSLFTGYDTHWNLYYLPGLFHTLSIYVHFSDSYTVLLLRAPVHRSMRLALLLHYFVLSNFLHGLCTPFEAGALICFHGSNMRSETVLLASVTWTERCGCLRSRPHCHRQVKLTAVGPCKISLSIPPCLH